MKDFRTRVGKTQDEPDHLVSLERKAVLRKQKYGACQRDTGSNVNELPLIKAKTICTIN